MQNKEKVMRAESSFWANVFKSKPLESDLIKILKEIPPFMELKKNQLPELIKIIHNRQYLAGEYIFLQGDPGIALYVIREGAVDIEYALENGEQITIATFSAGDFFGELAMIDGDLRSASAKAKVDTKLSIIFKPDLDEFIHKYPKSGVTILTGISKIIALRLRNQNDEYVSLIDEFNSFKESKNENS